MVVDEIARRVRADPFKGKHAGECARASIGAERAALLLKPSTFMNQSGRSVRAAMDFFKIEPVELCVIHDELDLPAGTVRMKFGGGHAGHNGLASIATHVGTTDFLRIRVGIGRPPAGFQGAVADFVLRPFDPLEAVELPRTIERATRATLDWAERGLQAAMNATNVREKKPKPPSSVAPAEPTAQGPDARERGERRES